MTISPTHHKARLQSRLSPSLSQPVVHRPAEGEPGVAPVLAAVDGSSSDAAVVDAAVGLGRDLRAPVVFVYVRRGPSSVLGAPYYQRRLDAEIRVGRRAVKAAGAVARRAHVPASGEELDGNPAERILEFARLRDARLVVLGSPRRRLGRSVSRAAIRRADRAVLIAAPGRRLPVERRLRFVLGQLRERPSGAAS